MFLKTISLFLPTVYLVMNSAILIGQNDPLEWDVSPRGQKANLEKAFPVGNNQLMIIENNLKKPVGLKPYLYTFNDSDNSLSVKCIEGYKHMEIYRMFFSSPFSFQTINDKTYRIDVEYDKKKFDKHIYSVSLQQINLDDLSNVGQKNTLLQSVTTANDGRSFTISNDKYLVFVKSGATAYSKDKYLDFVKYGEPEVKSVFEDGEGYDIFVFEATNFNLVYSKSVSLSTNLLDGTDESITLGEDGSLYVKVKLYDKSMKLKERYKTPNSIKVMRISEDDIIENTIELEQTSINSDLLSNSNDILTILALDKDDSNLSIQTRINSCESAEVVDNRIISITEILNKNSSTFGKRFSKTLSESQNIYGNSIGSYTLTTSNGEAITVCNLAFRPEKGLGMANLLFCTIVYRIDREGKIKWVNVIPLYKTICSILDQDDNLHVYTNGITEEYDEDGNYVGNDKVEMNAHLSPVEVILSQEDGELISNKVLTKGFENEQGFSVVNVSYHFNENCSFIGKNSQGNLNSLHSSKNNGIIFGIVRF